MRAYTGRITIIKYDVYVNKYSAASVHGHWNPNSQSAWSTAVTAVSMILNSNRDI